MLRTASAQWKGGLKDGKGTISSASGTLSNTQYSFGTRFESGKGTNPEELIAAAHAGCFSMALSAELGKASITPESIETKCTVTFEKTDAGFTITESHLDVKARIPGGNKAAFDKATSDAKAGCAISRCWRVFSFLNIQRQPPARARLHLRVKQLCRGDAVQPGTCLSRRETTPICCWRSG